MYAGSLYYFASWKAPSVGGFRSMIALHKGVSHCFFYMLPVLF